MPDIPCACATVRRLSRLLTQMYDQHLRPSGVEAPQMVLLGTLSALPGLSQAALGARLALDKTTLSRNLRWLASQRWIELSPSPQDRRRKGYRLTGLGEERLAAAKPLWEAAQSHFESTMSAAEWQQMWSVLRRATDAAAGVNADPDSAASTRGLAPKVVAGFDELA
ncbi:MAG: MarR family winged helix-turn-helix transcriptional regulator [Bryobacteraceae bacterium]|nr:MarR family winged helix-turn-helix transcriptional regulator [Bryobacteraceae bacterium]